MNQIRVTIIVNTEMTEDYTADAVYALIKDDLPGEILRTTAITVTEEDGIVVGKVLPR